jgi:hypothetical protein
MKMNFSDGMTIETGGEYRIIHKRDGLYVVGHGTLCAVDSRAEGQEMIDEFRAIEARNKVADQH